MSFKRKYYDTYIDDYFDYVFAYEPSKSFKMAASASSSDASMASNFLSAQIGSHAHYTDRRRFRHPRLANNYAACSQTIRYNAGGGAGLLQIPGSSTDADQIYAWTPTFSPDLFLGESLPTALFAAYNEFRVRSVKISFNPVNHQPVGLPSDQVARMGAFIWLPREHSGLNVAQEIGTTFTQMCESGERFFKVARNGHSRFQFTYVPQVITDIWSNAATQHIDTPMPWVNTSVANKSAVWFSPYFVWHLPYTGSIATAAQYQINVTAVFEFRDVKGDQD